MWLYKLAKKYYFTFLNQFWKIIFHVDINNFYQYLYLGSLRTCYKAVLGNRSEGRKSCKLKLVGGGHSTYKEGLQVHITCKSSEQAGEHWAGIMRLRGCS